MIYRLLNIMVERLQEEQDAFCHAVPTALREYADALARDNAKEIDGTPFEVDGECVRFKASNGCIVKIIAGCYTPNQ
ncbi:MAG: hypothetical protein A3G93_07090 [Nitrospinae bacterium RIFCSPLOWO2_12_FULL_45_22]|nr:MAG: hypothetical protein A3G93_07090 [Nitrospinae bacterium RIFCSPLOWO2_12_FULL_45_22]